MWILFGWSCEIIAQDIFDRTLDALSESFGSTAYVFSTLYA